MKWTILLTAAVWAKISIPLATQSSTISKEAAAFVKGLGKGWNLGNSLDSFKLDDIAHSDETSWGNPRVTKELLQAVKDLGFTSIRIPVTYDTRFEADGFTIKPEWLDRVEEVIDWALALHFYVITNMAHDSQTWADYRTVTGLEQRKEKFQKVWAQIATRLAEKSLNLIFEPLNEPAGDTATEAAVYGPIIQSWANSVRKSGGLNDKRHITVPCSRSYWWFLQCFSFDDPGSNWSLHLHLYDPYAFLFGAYGATEWGTDADKQSVLDTIETALAVNPALIIGEYAVVVPEDMTRRAGRREWYAFHNALFEKHGIAGLVWDNGDMLDRKTLTWRNPDYSLASIMQPNSVVADVSAVYVKHKSKVPSAQSIILSTSASALSTVVSTVKNSITTITGFAGLPIAKPVFDGKGQAHYTLPQTFLQAAASQDIGKTGIVFKFETGAPLSIPLVVYDLPSTPVKTYHITTLGKSKTPKGTNLVIPFDFQSSELAGVRGVVIPPGGADSITLANMQCAAVGSFPSNQIDPTAGFPLDRRCYMVWGVDKQFTLDDKSVNITKSFIDSLPAGDVLLTFDFFPRGTGNQVNLTLSVEG